MSTIDLKKCTISFKDGTGTPKVLVVKIGEGTITYDEKRNILYDMDRGKIDSVRAGDEVPMDVRLTVRWEWLRSLTGALAPTPEEALKRIGVAATLNWKSSDPDLCSPYAIDIEIKFDPDCSDLGFETITLPDFRWESMSHDPKAGTLDVSGKCNAKMATVVRSAQSDSNLGTL